MSVHHRASRRSFEGSSSLLAMNSSAALISQVIARVPSVTFWGSQTRMFFYEELQGEAEEEEKENPRWSHKMPPNPTWCDRLQFPFYSLRAWMRLLCDNFDSCFIIMIVCGQHLLKGLLAGGGSQGMLLVEGLIYMKLQLGAPAKATFQSISHTAWGLKPLYALVTDAVQIHGYRQTPWVFATAMAAIVAYISLVSGSRDISGTLACLCFFFAKMQLAWTDLVMEQRCNAKMVENPQHVGDIMAFVCLGVGFFGLLGIMILGTAVDFFGTTLVLVMAIPAASLVLFPTSAGCLEEEVIPLEQRNISLKQFEKHRCYSECTLALFLGMTLSMISGLLGAHPGHQVLVALLAVAVTGTAPVALLPSTVWMPLLYIFLANALNINLVGIAENFYLDPATTEGSQRTGLPVCVDCPHFTTTFYYTVVGILDSLFMLVGSLVFNTFLPTWTYRSALSLAQGMLTAGYLLDMVQYQRWNLWLGISDWFFMFFKRSIQSVAGMIAFMPVTILISKVCPEGQETRLFGLLAGLSTFGTIISGYFGAFIIELAGMQDIGQGTNDDFSQAWKACLMSALICAISLILVPILVPSTSMAEELQEDTDNAPDELRLFSGSTPLFAEYTKEFS